MKGSSIAWKKKRSLQICGRYFKCKVPNYESVVFYFIFSINLKKLTAKFVEFRNMLLFSQLDGILNPYLSGSRDWWKNLWIFQAIFPLCRKVQVSTFDYYVSLYFTENARVFLVYHMALNGNSCFVQWATVIIFEDKNFFLSIQLYKMPINFVKVYKSNDAVTYCFLIDGMFMLVILLLLLFLLVICSLLSWFTMVSP